MTPHTRLALLLCLVIPTLHGAGRTHLAGRVDDASGAVLVDVALSAVNEDTGIRRTARTDGAGLYTLGPLEPGIYKVTARKPGF